MELVYGEANSEFAIAWLSRLPIERAVNHRAPVFGKTLLEVQVDGRRLYTTHLVHGRTKPDADHRVEEVREILPRVRDQCVLVGDFNAVHPDDDLGSPPPEEQASSDFVAREPIRLLVESGFIDCYRALHPAERGWTYKTSHPWVRLDYVFARGLEPLACEVVVEANGASDHFPLVAELA
jgi:endonuclease/exonuclease/phosphatase family metal-dependent hydrolase